MPFKALPVARRLDSAIGRRAFQEAAAQAANSARTEDGVRSTKGNRSASLTQLRTGPASVTNSFLCFREESGSPLRFSADLLRSGYK